MSTPTPHPSLSQPESYSPSPDNAPSTSQLSQVRSAISSLLSQPSYDDGSAGPVLVRLAWHSAGTFDAATRSGGSNGAGMRWESEGGDPANAGLQHARAFLEPIKHQFPWLTYSDLWTLAAVVAIEAMGGPHIEWKGGRTDFANESDKRIPPRGRLPDGSKGADHLRWIFYRMGFDDREIVALSGAHNLGRCHADRSGFEGKWVNNPTRFSNQYFRLLLANDWKKKKLDNGVEQYVYVDEDSLQDVREANDGKKPSAEEIEEATLMMLPSDMALLEDAKMRVWVQKYAQDKDLFFDHFAKVFSKLLELGIQRDGNGNVINADNVRDGYKSAPKKSDRPTAPEKDQNKGQIGHEALVLKEQNRDSWAKL